MPSLLAVLGFMLTPRSLELAGAGMGLASWWLAAVFVVLAFSQFFTARSTEALQATGGGVYGDFAGLSPALAAPLAGLGFAARLGLFLFLACSLTGLAGYDFNEAYWQQFPNFLFTFILLVGVGLLNLAGDATARRAAYVMGGVVAGCVLATTAGGFFLLADATQAPGIAPQAESPFWDALVLCAPLVIGHEMARRLPGSEAASRPVRFMRGGVFFALVIFGLWAWVCMLHTGSEWMAKDLPARVYGRKVWGATGYFLMSTAAIVSVAAVLHLFLMQLKAPLRYLAARQGLPGLFRATWRTNALAVVPAVAAVSALLLMGYAGEPETEDFIAGGFALWFVYYAGVNLAGLVHGVEGTWFCRQAPKMGLAANLGLAGLCLHRATEPGPAAAYAAFWLVLALVFGLVIKSFAKRAEA